MFCKELTLLYKSLLSLVPVASKQFRGMTFPMRIATTARERDDLHGQVSSLAKLSTPPTPLGCYFLAASLGKPTEAAKGKLSWLTITQNSIPIAHDGQDAESR